MRRTNELTPVQKWERATLADNFIFCKVMSSAPEVCKEVLELLLGIEIDRIEQSHTEHSMRADYDSKGIRFDVYVKDGTGRCIDVEVQTTDKKDLARRARYSQGLMDVDCFPCDEDYEDLKDGYIIFLCLDDPFGRGLPVYTFKNRCRENKDILLNDGSHKIFYNAAKHADMPSEPLKSFFRFLAGAADDSARSGRLAALVKQVKSDTHWGQQFIAWEEEVQLRTREAAEAAYQAAFAVAAAQKAVETARNFLAQGLSPEKVAQGTGLPLEQVERLRQEASATKAEQAQQ